MSARLWNLLIFTAIIAAMVCYLYFLNPEIVQVRWGPGQERVLNSPLALVIVTIFFLGAATSASLTLLLGFRTFWRELRTLRKQRIREANQKRIFEAREELAIGNLHSARKQFLAIIEKDPEDLASRIALAETYEDEGLVEQAIKVLQATPLSQKTNREVLANLAELHAGNGNRLAACDALRLLLVRDPKNPDILRRLSELSAELSKFDEAFEYGEQYARVAKDSGERKVALADLAEIELRQAQQKLANNQELYQLKLEEILKRHHEFGPALKELAEVECRKLNLEAANRLFQRAFRSLKTVDVLRSIAELWLSVDEPKKALANVSLLVKEVKTSPPESGKLFLIALLLLLEQIDDAKRELDSLKATGSSMSHIQSELAVISSMLLRKSGNESEANDLLLATVGQLLPDSPLQLLSRARENALNIRNGSSVKSDSSIVWPQQAKLLAQSANQPPAKLLGS